MPCLSAKADNLHSSQAEPKSLLLHNIYSVSYTICYLMTQSPIPAKRSVSWY